MPKKRFVLLNDLDLSACGSVAVMLYSRNKLQQAKLAALCRYMDSWQSARYVVFCAKPA